MSKSFGFLVLGYGCWVLAYSPQTGDRFASTQHRPNPGPSFYHTLQSNSPPTCSLWASRPDFRCWVLGAGFWRTLLRREIGLPAPGTDRIQDPLFTILC